MGGNAFGRAGVGKLPVEGDEIEARANRKLEVRSIVERQAAALGECAERADVRHGMVGAKRELGGVVENLEPLLAPKALSSLRDQERVRKFEAPEIRHPAFGAFEQLERGVGE